MQDSSFTHRAFAFKRWADERTLAAVAQLTPDAPEGAQSFAHQQLNHMVIVEELFTSRLLNQPPPHPETNSQQVPEFTELRERLMASNVWYTQFIDRTDQLDTVLRFEFADGKRGAMSIEEILFHVLTHGSYHRGNIARCLDTSGIAHPVDGYGIYIHDVEPQRRAILNEDNQASETPPSA